MIRAILTLLNTMAFCGLLIFGLIKIGFAEEVIKNAAKGVVKDVVQEELKDRFKDNVPTIPEKNWWER